MDSRSFFYEFGRLFYKIDSLYADIAKQENVKPNLLWILYALDDGNSHTQKEISITWDIPLTTINTIVIELFDDGYVDFNPIKGKRREKYIVLTEKGKEYSKTVLKNLYNLEEEVFNVLDERIRINDDMKFMLERFNEFRGE